MKRVLAAFAVLATFGIAFVSSASLPTSTNFATATSCIKCLERCADLGYSNEQCLNTICTEECGTGT